MKKQNKPIFVPFSLILSALFLYCSTSASTHELEVEDEREFDYMEKSGKGPNHWGDLKKEWAACKNGDLQSPIDLSNRRVKVIKKKGVLQKIYKFSQSIIKNRGHDISLQWPNNDAGLIKINGTQYFLLQAHWHSPSEHTINGERYALEVHMVHQCKDPKVKNNIAVVALLYKFGSPNPFLSKLISNITVMNDHIQERPMGVIDPNLIEIDGKRYYRYIGSLTVPPCTEGVIWTINKKIKSVSRDQVHAIRVAVHDLQWLNNDAGMIKINGTPYFLQQAHWHSPSEHTVNGERYALEVHMVHQCKDPEVKNNIDVVALLYKFGSPNPFLSKRISNITVMNDHIQERPMRVIDPNLIEIDGKRYYRYIGSLTVPPCTEGVIWTINKKYAEENARPVQSLNQRKMELYGP